MHQIQDRLVKRVNNVRDHPSWMSEYDLYKVVLLVGMYRLSNCVSVEKYNEMMMLEQVQQL